MTADRTTDVLIIGGGPAGSSAALRLLAAGITPIIVEREQFPRFHIGESMTGECGRLVRSMGFEEKMTEAGHPVKHGVSVFGSRGNQDWWVPMSKRTPSGELALSPTYQVRRSVFDKMLLDAAVEQGAVLVPGRAVEPVVSDDGTVLGATIRTDDGTEMTIEATITLDCSGQASFLANKGVTGPKYMGSYDKQIAVFTQVAGYQRDDIEGDPSRQRGNTHIFYTRKFHWAWGIPIDDETTSVGIVIPAEYFRSKKETRDEFVAREIHELNAGLAGRVADSEIVEAAHVIPNYSFQVRKFAGPGYICVGDSHRFVDPIFSFGMFVAIQEAHYAAEAVVGYLAGAGRDSADPFHEYMVAMEMAIDILEDTIDTFWENPLAFAFLVHNRYRDQLTDVFSGRIYEGMTNPELEIAIAAFRKLLERERTYDDEGLYSVPIGSRYQPDRAPLWNSKLDSVETTETWLRDVTVS
jgi:flavin-dependent dehydrogenase